MSLYHQLPETLEMQHAKEAYQLQSEVRACPSLTSTVIEEYVFAIQSILQGYKETLLSHGYGYLV